MEQSTALLTYNYTTKLNITNNITEYTDEIVSPINSTSARKSTQININNSNRPINNNITTIANDHEFQICVLCFYGQGQKKTGVEKGPYYLHNMFKDIFNLKKHAFVTTECKYMAPNEPLWRIEFEELYNYLSKQGKYILLGGDHSLGNPSVNASISKMENVDDLYVIWIDAHADLNTYKQSGSKNYHGQPLASIMGYEEPWYKAKAIMKPTNLSYFGLRSLDPFEIKKIKEDSIFYTSKVDDMLKHIEFIIEKNPGAKFHVSWDVDSMNPNCLDATGCLEPEGLVSFDVYSVVNAVYSRLTAFDVVEFNPNLGNVEKSLETIKEVILKIKQ